jgi:LPS sulfotransferase NodH
MTVSAEHREAIERVFTMPPVDTKYVAGRWHHDRATYRGFALETRVLLKSLTVPAHRNRRFLIVGRARSGTSLLTRLLNGHSQIHCDGEVLKLKVFAPQGLLDRLAAKSRAPAYGAKLLSYQMVQIQRIRDPGGFLGDLAARGYVLIHLTRETFSQTLSLMVAGTRRMYRPKAAPEPLAHRLRLDPEDFARRLEWNDALLAYETAAFSGLDHVAVRYEADLMDAARHGATLDRICAALGMPPEPVEATSRKMLPSDAGRVIENLDEVIAAAAARGLGHLVPRALSDGSRGKE